MATPVSKIPLGGFALRLVQQGVVDEEKAEKLQAGAAKHNCSFFTEAISNGKVDTTKLIRSASEEFGIPLFDIKSIDIDAAPVQLLKESLIEKHKILPIFKRGAKDPHCGLRPDELTRTGRGKVSHRAGGGIGTRRSQSTRGSHRESDRGKRSDFRRTGRE